MVEVLKIANREPEASPPYDAALIHVYWMSERESGTTLSLRSHMAARAGALAYHSGLTKSVVVDMGNLWGGNYPAEGALVSSMLTERYQVPPDAVITRTQAYSTCGEVITMTDLAKEHSWKRIMDMAFERHLPTIKLLYSQYTDQEVHCMSIETLINSYDRAEVGGLLKRFKRSPYEWNYCAYELMKLLVMRLPQFDCLALERHNKQVSVKKRKPFFLPIDVYR